MNIKGLSLLCTAHTCAYVTGDKNVCIIFVGALQNCACMSVQLEPSANVCPLTVNGGVPSHKAKQGVSRVSGCYSYSWTNMST